MGLGVGGNASGTLRVEGKGQGTLQAPNQGRGHPIPPSPGSLQVRELVETLPILLLLLVLCAMDWALYSIFDTIGRHSYMQYTFRSEPGPEQGQPLLSPPPLPSFSASFPSVSQEKPRPHNPSSYRKPSLHSDQAVTNWR